MGYNDDVLLWSREQAELLRSGQFSKLDIEHLADEIEDVGKSEKRELASRMAVLLAHLLKWQYQPSRRGRSWQTTIRTQRAGIAAAIEDTPSLKAVLLDPKWARTTWADAVDQATREADLDIDLGDTCPWSFDEVLTNQWYPTGD